MSIYSHFQLFFFKKNWTQRNRIQKKKICERENDPPRLWQISKVPIAWRRILVWSNCLPLRLPQGYILFFRIWLQLVELIGVAKGAEDESKFKWNFFFFFFGLKQTLCERSGHFSSIGFGEDENGICLEDWLALDKCLQRFFLFWNEIELKAEVIQIFYLHECDQISCNHIFIGCVSCLFQKGKQICFFYILEMQCK